MTTMPQRSRRAIRRLLHLSVGAIALAALAACSTRPVGPDYAVPADAVALRVHPGQSFASAGDATLANETCSSATRPCPTTGGTSTATRS